MQTRWIVKDVVEHTCSHGLPVIHVELEWDFEGEKYASTLSYHLVDLYQMSGDVQDNLRHLIDVHVASEVASLIARKQLAGLRGLTGEVTSVEEVLALHPSGTAADHPELHPVALPAENLED